MGPSGATVASCSSVTAGVPGLGAAVTTGRAAKAVAGPTPVVEQSTRLRRGQVTRPAQPATGLRAGPAPLTPVARSDAPALGRPGPAKPSSGLAQPVASSAAQPLTPTTVDAVPLAEIASDAVAAR